MISAYEWSSYDLQVMVTFRGGNQSGYLLTGVSQEDFLEVVRRHMPDREPVGFLVTTLTEDAFDMLREVYGANKILEG